MQGNKNTLHITKTDLPRLQRDRTPSTCHPQISTVSGHSYILISRKRAQIGETHTFWRLSGHCSRKLTSEDRQPLGESGSSLVSSGASGAASGGACASSSKRRRWEAGEGGARGGPSLVGRRGVAMPRLCWKCSWLRKQPVPVWLAFRPLADSPPSVLFPSAWDRLWPARRRFGGNAGVTQGVRSLGIDVPRF